MRYVISTIDEQGIIGMQLKKWKDEGKLEIIEREDTLIEIEAKLEKVAAALKMLHQVGYNSEVMTVYLMNKTRVARADIEAVMGGQQAFLRQIGALR